MIDRIDRVQIAVKSIDKAAATFNRLLGAEVIDRSYSQYLNASRIVMALGESEIELCQADGAGYLGARLSHCAVLGSEAHRSNPPNG